MEITIGVQNLPRELTLESDKSTQEVAEAVRAAVSGTSSVLELVDERGRLLIVPADKIGYVEIGAEQRGRVGFSSL